MSEIQVEEKIDFSKFGKAFQEKIVHLMVDDRAFCDQVREVLNVNYLETKYLQVMVQKLFDHKDKFEIHPGHSTIATVLRTELDEETEITQKQVRDFFARVQSTPVVEDAEYVKQTSLEFCKKQKLKEALIKSAKMLQKSSSFEEIRGVVNKAIQLGSDNNFGYDYKIDFERRYEKTDRKAITTGWAEIDAITKGGLGRGELGVIIAPTGAGKSMALTHLGAAALIEGHNVVHYTLELSDTAIGCRYDSAITDIKMDDLYNSKKEVIDIIESITGKLIIKEYPTRSASVLTIRNHLAKLKNCGHRVDLVIVDYGDLLITKTSTGARYSDMEVIYEELRGLSQEMRCPIWTASQTNRTGLNAEVVTLESIADAFNKCFVADFIATISRTIKDKAENGGRFFVAKNRQGVDGIVFPLYMDTSCVKVDVLPQTGETVDSIRDEEKKNAVKNLKSAYSKFKSSTNEEEEE